MAPMIQFVRSVDMELIPWRNLMRGCATLVRTVPRNIDNKYTHVTLQATQSVETVYQVSRYLKE